MSSCTPARDLTPAVVGLRRERQVLTVALEAGRHVVIEGPPGTGKSTLLRDVARAAGRDVVFVEGNAELTPARLVGQYDPALVLAAGYVPASFTDGPLLAAMRGGALLYLEEFNRIPEETLNVLITVLAEGEIAVPRLGTVAAHTDFRLIAAMNPFDAIGTARVSQAIADRICRVVLGYQDAAAERQITTAVAGETGPAVDFAVALARATRDHRDVRMGASVRGAIDLVLLATGLARLRGEGVIARETARDAAYAALSGKIRMADGCDRTPESVLDELLGEVWPAGAMPPVTDAGRADGRSGPGKADCLPPAGAAGRSPSPVSPSPVSPSPVSPSPVSRSSLRRDRGLHGSGRTVSRTDLAARHASFGDVSPTVGELDTGALARLLAADPDGAATLLADLAHATDKSLATAARRLAARVFVKLAPSGARPARGTRRLGPGSGEGDLDLGRTLDRLSGSWPPAQADLVTRTWRAHGRALCLLVDTSGSMSGLAVAIAAVAAAGVALAGDQRPGPGSPPPGPSGAWPGPGVIAFGSEVTVLQSLGSRKDPEELVGELIALRGHGLTDLAGGLRAAARELAGSRADERVTILLSDCLRTAGRDPASALAGVGALHVLCPLPGPESRRAAADLARLGGGTSLPVRRLADIGPALTRALSG